MMHVRAEPWHNYSWQRRGGAIGGAVAIPLACTTYVPEVYIILSSLLLSSLYFVEGFALSVLLDKKRSQVSSLLLPGTCLNFITHRVQFSIRTARRFFIEYCCYFMLSRFPPISLNAREGPYSCDICREIGVSPRRADAHLGRAQARNI